MAHTLENSVKYGHNLGQTPYSVTKLRVSETDKRIALVGGGGGRARALVRDGLGLGLGLDLASIRVRVRVRVGVRVRARVRARVSAFHVVPLTRVLLAGVRG